MISSTQCATTYPAGEMTGDSPVTHGRLEVRWALGDQLTDLTSDRLDTVAEMETTRKEHELDVQSILGIHTVYYMKSPIERETSLYQAIWYSHPSASDTVCM